MAVILLGLSYSTVTSSAEPNTTSPFSKWSFKSYLKKFSPTVIFERLDKAMKSKNLNVSKQHILKEMGKYIDETDEILRIPLPTGSRRSIKDDGFQWVPLKKWFDMPWTPPGHEDMSWYTEDPQWLRPRLFNLMKQTIYQARDYMVIMQKLRAKYNTHSLYRMGFLTSKLDNTCKVFSGFAFKAFRACTSRYWNYFARLTLYELVDSEERLLNLWFDIDLFKALYNENYNNCVDMLTKTIRGRKEKEWYKDEFVFN